MIARMFDLLAPERTMTSVIFASPHSGRDYPEAWLQASLLDSQQIRSSEDAFIDRLFACATDFGAPLLAARVPRAWIDLNRAADEFDPALIEGVRRRGHNPRIASGLGVIPRVVANGRAIYRGKLTLEEAQNRIDSAWYPYHAALSDLVRDAHRSFGEAILMDCHSMPHEAVANLAIGNGRRPDVVIGDRFGASAGAGIVDQVEAAFIAAGLKVVRNAPFAGAYVTQHYGRPSRGQHAVQIEIDRALYMDEARVEPRADFARFEALLRNVVQDIAAIGRAEQQPLAAE